MQRVGTLEAGIGGTGSLCGRLSGGGALAGAVSISGGAAYRGDYEVIPRADEAVILPTAGARLSQNVTVLEIPYYETSNPSGGYTAIIGG